MKLLDLPDELLFVILSFSSDSSQALQTATQTSKRLFDVVQHHERLLYKHICTWKWKGIRAMRSMPGLAILKYFDYDYVHQHGGLSLPVKLQHTSDIGNSPFESKLHCQEMAHFVQQSRAKILNDKVRFEKSEQRTKYFERYAMLNALASTLCFLFLILVYLADLVPLQWLFSVAHCAFFGYVFVAGLKWWEWCSVPHVKTVSNNEQRIGFLKSEKLRDALVTTVGLAATWLYATAIMKRFEMTVSGQQPHGWTVLFTPINIALFVLTMDIWNAAQIWDLLHDGNKLLKVQYITSQRFINALLLPTLTWTVIWVCLWMDELVSTRNFLNITIGPVVMLCVVLIIKTAHSIYKRKKMDANETMEKALEACTIWFLLGLGLGMSRVWAAMPLAVLMMSILLVTLGKEVKKL